MPVPETHMHSFCVSFFPDMLWTDDRHVKIKNDTHVESLNPEISRGEPEEGTGWFCRLVHKLCSKKEEEEDDILIYRLSTEIEMASDFGVQK